MTQEIKIQKLQKLIIESLVPLIDSDYVLLDIPNHGNIGDHLIYEGEIIFLRNHIKHKNLYSSDCTVFDQLKIGNNTILLHGGGNFGDIYDLHQNYRLNIIKKYPNNRIIILPQTVYYNNPDKLKEDCDIFNAHKDLYICVRDTLSYDLLAQYIVDKSKLFLLPDMAFFIDFSKYIKSAKSNRVLIMHRIDVESVGEPDKDLIRKLESDGCVVDVKDWPTYYDTSDIKRYNLFNRLRFKLLKILSNFPIVNHYVSSNTNDLLLKNHYIKMGVKFMQEYDVVYTTRLHGLILAILLNKKIIALDNSYGKLSSFYNTWLSGFENISLLSKK